MQHSDGRLDRKLVTLLMMAVFAARWIISLAAGLLIFWLLSDKGLASVSEPSEPITEVENFLANDSNSDLFDLRELVAFSVAIVFAFMVNGVISGVAVRKLASPSNRLWAFTALLLVPIFVAGSLASVVSLLSSLDRNLILLISASIDFASVMIITWRMCIDKSPFANLNLIDSSDPKWETTLH